MPPSGEVPRIFPTQSRLLTKTLSRVESSIWASAPDATAPRAKHQNSRPALIHPLRSSPPKEPNTQKPKYSGSPNTAFAELVCSRTDSGTPIWSYGGWQHLSSVSTTCPQESRKNWPRKEERWRIGASDWTLVRRAIRGSPQFESELEVTMQMITRRKAVRLLGAGAAGAWFAAAQTGLNLSFPPSASAKPRFHSSA